MKDVSIIIVSYNTEKILHECLTAVKDYASQNLSIEIIVVDNASSDNSTKMVKKEFPQVTLIENKENLGFSKANNIGVKKSTGKYVLFLNSDAILKEKTLPFMVEVMEQHPTVGCATCKVVLPSGELDDASHRGFPTPWNAFCHFSGLAKIFPTSKLFSGYSLGWKNMDTQHEIDACAGAFMIVRRAAGEQIRWWDEDYFWYGEDLDFCYTLSQKGWNILYLPEVSVLHYKGVSGGIKKASATLSVATDETKKRATKARFNAMRIFYKKHYEQIYPKFLTWLVYKGIALKEWSVK